MPRLASNIVEHGEGQPHEVAESDVNLAKSWSSIRENYNSIGWNEEFPETLTELHISNPESLIAYRSEQLTHALVTEHDLQELIEDISLLTRIAEANNIEIGTESPLYRVILQMSKIPNNRFEHLRYPEIYILADTSERASKLIPEAEENTETYILRGRLVDMANRAYDFLDFGGDEYEPEYYEDEEEYRYFNPHSYLTLSGEESHYNNTNTAYEGENNFLTRYNIDKSDPGNTYFKSCGIFVTVGESQIAKIDFTPFNATSPGEVDPRVAMAMAYRGMKNFLHAFEQHQLGNVHLIALSGTTNPTMAQFASRFGFRVEVGGSWLSRDEMKAQKIDLDKRLSCNVIGTIEDIRRELAKFEAKGIGERLVKGISKN